MKLQTLLKSRRAETVNAAQSESAKASRALFKALARADKSKDKNADLDAVIAAMDGEGIAEADRDQFLDICQTAIEQHREFTGRIDARKQAEADKKKAEAQLAELAEQAKKINAQIAAARKQRSAAKDRIVEAEAAVDTVASIENWFPALAKGQPELPRAAIVENNESALIPSDWLLGGKMRECGWGHFGQLQNEVRMRMFRKKCTQAEALAHIREHQPELVAALDEMRAFPRSLRNSIETLTAQTNETPATV